MVSSLKGILTQAGKAGIDELRIVVSLQASPSATTRQVALSIILQSID